MKKKVLFIFLLILFNCLNTDNSNGTNTEPIAQIRFSNNIFNYDIIYGIRIGQAIHQNALLESNISPYYNITPGNYDTIQLKDINGIWTRFIMGLYVFEENRKYTVLLRGTLRSHEAVIVTDINTDNE